MTVKNKRVPLNKKYQEINRVNIHIEHISKVAKELIESGRVPPKYFDGIDVIKELKILKDFPWEMDETITGISKATSGFVISKPTIEEYNNIPWNLYLEDGLRMNQKILVLGGGQKPKEVELINQYAEKRGICAQSKIHITDKKEISEISEFTWKNIIKPKYATLDITNTDKLYDYIIATSPTIVTLVSVLSIFDIEVQERILTSIYQALQPGGKVFFGTALPQTPINLIGYPLATKTNRVLLSVDDFISATLFSNKEQDKYPVLFQPQKLQWSKKAYDKYKLNAEANVEWSLYLTGQLNRLKRIGFIIKHVVLKGVEGKFGGGRPLALPPYMTGLLSKSPNIDLKLLYKLKTESITVTEKNIRIIPFNGTEISQYKNWFDRTLHKIEMQYEHRNTPYTTNPDQQVSVEEFIKFVIRSPHNVFFRIIHPDFGFVGHVSINSINWEEKTCWFSLHIGSLEHFGKGIGSPVERAILYYLKELGFKKVFTCTLPNNIGSIKMIEKYFSKINEKDEDGLIQFEVNLAHI